jgi:hypothetical protein
VTNISLIRGVDESVGVTNEVPMINDELTTAEKDSNVSNNHKFQWKITSLAVP